MIDIKEQVKFISRNKPTEESINCLIEEMAELVQALSKRNRGLESNISEEVGHVYLMLSVVTQQLQLNNKEIENAINSATLRFFSVINK